MDLQPVNNVRGTCNGLLVVSDLDGTLLDHEIEQLESGGLLAWVRVPLLSRDGTGTRLCVYSGLSLPPVDATQVWRADYRAVMHFNALLAESTGLVSTDGTGSLTDAGWIGRSLVLDSAKQHRLWIEDGPVAAGAPLTLALWVRAGAPIPGWLGLVTKGRDTNKDWYGLWARPSPNDPGGPHLVAFGWTGFRDNGGQGNLESDIVVPTDRWMYVVGTFDGFQQRLYVDGELVGQRDNVHGFIDSPTSVGNDLAPDNPSFDGQLDELRISTVCRSPEWIKTQYANQSNPQTFVRLR